MKWSDEDIDKLFKKAAEKHAVPYDESYWSEFEQNLHTSSKSLTDDQIDELFRKAADGHQIAYSPVFWNEFELSMPGVEPGWSDTEIDGLFKTEAKKQKVDYKEEYWHEFEETLPQERRRDVVWFFFAFTFISILGVMMMNDQPVDDDRSMTAKTALSHDDIEVLSQTNDQNSKAVNSTTGVLEESVVGSEYSPGEIINSINVPDNLVSNTVMTSDTWANTEETSGEIEEKGALTESRTDIESNPDEELAVDSEVTSETELIAPEEIDGLTPLDLGSVSVAAPTFTNVDYPKFRKPLFSFYAQGLGGISQSLITPSERLSHSYGLGFGTRILYKNFSINTGLNALISQHEDLELSRSAKVYGYGSTLYQYNLDYEHLYLIEGDLSISYNFKRSSFKVGLRPSYLISTRVRIEQSDVKSAQEILENSESRLNYGFNEGMKKLGIKPMLGYSYLLPRNNIELGLNVGVQLMQMVNEDFINGVNNKLPIDGQVYIRKYLHLNR